MNDLLPKVSIIIPVYNGSKYVGEAIESALNQTYKNIEIIVVNDGSTDNGKTEEVVKSFGDKVKYLNKENGGVSSALNLGLKNITGDYVSWLSHDDVYTPDKIEKQINLLAGQEDKRCLCLCDVRFIGADSKPISKSVPQRKTGKYNWREALSHVIDVSVNGCALLLPVSVFEDVGCFDESLRFCQDMLMWFEIFLDKYSMIVSSDVGVLSRWHREQVTKTRKDLFHHDVEYICQTIPEKMAAVDTKQDAFLFRFAKYLAVQGNTASVNKCLAVAEDYNLFSANDKFKLKLASFYGKIRPVIRKVYYALLSKKSN